MPILGREPYPEVTVAVLGDEQSQEVETQCQQAAHQLAFDLSHARAVVGGSPGEVDEALKIGLGLEEGLLEEKIMTASLGPENIVGW